MNAVKIIFGMLPFFLFSVLAPLVGAGWSAAIGLVAAIAVVAATARGGVKELPVAQGVLLLVMMFIGLAADPATGLFLVHYGPGFVGLALGLFMVATARTAPFTAQFARTSVPAEFWHTARFLEINRKISTAWGLAVLVAGLCHLVGAQIGIEGVALVMRIGLNQVVPLLVLLAAGAYTKRIADAATHLAQEHETRSENEAHGAHESGQVRS